MRNDSRKNYSKGKKFMLDMTEEQHRNIKATAAKCGMSMTEYFMVGAAELASKLSKGRKKGWDDVDKIKTG